MRTIVIIQIRYVAQYRCVYRAVQCTVSYMLMMLGSSRWTTLACRMTDYVTGITIKRCQLTIRIWVYDGVAYTLTRFNQEMQRTIQILNLNQILGYTPDPKYLMEHDNHLYMSVPERGILQFDIFGTYIRTIPITGLTKFQVIGLTIFYSKSPGVLDAFHIKTLQENHFELPANDYVDMCINQDRIYLLSKDSLSAYQFPLQSE